MSTSQTSIFRICTFNLRHRHDDLETPNEWTKRRPIVQQCLQHMKPHIIGTQEGDPIQLQHILEDLNKSVSLWSWVGDELDEWHIINAIFYRHDHFVLVSTNTFWFNDPPTVRAAAWGAKHPRGCTRAQFREIDTQRIWTIYNVHLDFPSEEARHHSIPILLSQIKQYGDDIDQVIITGDFNNWPEQIEGQTPLDQLIELGQKASEIKQMKEAGFVDTYQHGETPSFNGFRSYSYGPKIDFIWISKNSIYSVAGETKIDDFHDQDGFFPSDHFPVYTDLGQNFP